MAAASTFSHERYIATFNQQFQVAAVRKGAAFRCTTQADLDWSFTVQAEGVVAKENTVATGDRTGQVEKSRFRSSLTWCTVNGREYLDGLLSVHYCLHVLGC